MNGSTPPLRMPAAEQEVDLERAVRLLGAYPELGPARRDRLRLLGVGWDNTVWLLDERWTLMLVRELLLGSVEVGTARWPRDLHALLGRRGFVEEVRRLLARVRQIGLDPVDLAELAAVEGRPDWHAAAAFCDEYLDVLELRGVLDYGELVRSAAALAAKAMPTGTNPACSHT